MVSIAFTLDYYPDSAYAGDLTGMRHLVTMRIPPLRLKSVS